jgi:hypothetical protein
MIPANNPEEAMKTYDKYLNEIDTTPVIPGHVFAAIVAFSILIVWLTH